MGQDASNVYLLKITLRDIRPPIWRRIELKGSTSLYKLHQIIQEAFGWFDAHLHQFISCFTKSRRLPPIQVVCLSNLRIFPMVSRFDPLQSKLGKIHDVAIQVVG